MSDLIPIDDEGQEQSSHSRAIFRAALLKRFPAEKVDRAIDLMQQPIDQLTDHERKIVNLLLMWACLRNAQSGPMGMRVATGGKLVRFNFSQQPRLFCLPGPVAKIGEH